MKRGSRCPNWGRAGHGQDNPFIRIRSGRKVNTGGVRLGWGRERGQEREEGGGEEVRGKGKQEVGAGEVRGWKNVEGRGRWEEGEIMGRRGVRERL